MPALTPDQSDRAAGVLIGLACADALGAPHEFHPPLAPDVPLTMSGGGDLGWAPGEWTDDTQMAVVVLQAAERARAAGTTLLDALDDVATGWDEWSRTARDVGIQTSSVFAMTRRSGAANATAMRAAAEVHHHRTGRSGGNGSLMRTAPVALAYLHDADALADAARQVSGLTHHEDDAGDACVLWCAAIRHAVLHGELDLRGALTLLPVERRSVWAARIEEAEAASPVDFPQNGWVVHAFQAAWSAIATTPVPDDVAAGHLREATETAVRCGGDTDTVAAIAGSLLGARWGASAVPAEWRDVVHGWPGLGAVELAERGRALAEGAAQTT